MYFFWYRFVRPNCKQYLYLPHIYERLPFTVGNMGRWWGNNSKEKRREEIDVMSVSGEKALLCECKWRNEKTDRMTELIL